MMNRMLILAIALCLTVITWLSVTLQRERQEFLELYAFAEQLASDNCPY